MSVAQLSQYPSLSTKPLSLSFSLSLSLSLSLRREALELWKQRLGSDATYNNLIRVFENAGYRDLADFIRKIAGIECVSMTLYWLYSNRIFTIGHQDTTTI